MNESQHTTEQPEILEAHWDFEQIDNLFEDLHQGADVQHVQVRATSDGRSEDRVVTLLKAQSLLHSGEAKAIQIRYGFDNQNWCDTLMVDATTVRIIRTRLD